MTDRIAELPQGQDDTGGDAGPHDTQRSGQAEPLINRAHFRRASRRNHTRGARPAAAGLVALCPSLRQLPILAAELERALTGHPPLASCSGRRRASRAVLPHAKALRRQRSLAASQQPRSVQFRGVGARLPSSECPACTRTPRRPSTSTISARGCRSCSTGSTTRPGSRPRGAA